MIRVILVDDYEVLRNGLRALLGSYDDLQVVGEVGSGGELLDFLAHTAVDVVVMDVLIPGMDGAEAARLVQEQHPNVKVLGLSIVTDPAKVMALFEAGVSGYALKSAGISEVVFAIRRVAAGLSFLSTALGIASLREVMDPSAHKPLKCKAALAEEPAHRALSRRELEVLQLVATGLSNGQIAERLFTSKRTVETHRQNIIAKTQCKNTAALMLYALRAGMV